jgi:hypothetical protein
MKQAMTQPTDEELTQLYKEVNGEIGGKAQPLTAQRIFKAMRAAIEKWGTPTPAGEPVAEVVECAVHGQQTLVEIDGRWKFLRYGDLLYTAPPVREPLTPEQINAAAKALAECMDYPWDHMPEKGRAEMRKHAVTVISAAHGITKGEPHADT